MDEDEFHLICSLRQVAKILCHWELFKMIVDVPGFIVECGVFKGGSLLRFAMFRRFTRRQDPVTRFAVQKKMIAFDTFGKFPPASYGGDVKPREAFITKSGDESFSTEQITDMLTSRNCGKDVELVQGDICETVPEYVKNHPDLQIAMLNMDTDLYEPAKVILEHLYPLIVKGGILISDNYGIFPGETKAVQEKFGRESILGLDFFAHPYYIQKEV